MPYLIDGHNLIARVPGIDLGDPDDEIQLISILVGFSARSRHKITVYFDRGSFGSRDPNPKGGVSVHFVTEPVTADDAIRRHLDRLGREAKNWTVVSSDREVRIAAQHSGATPMSSDQFAGLLKTPSPDNKPDEKPDTPLSKEEVRSWEEIFRQRS